jgi:hypothetical protein
LLAESHKEDTFVIRRRGPAGPGTFRARLDAPFDLAASRAIYSPLAESHEEDTFVIRRGGAEKIGTPFQKGEGRDG